MILVQTPRTGERNKKNNIKQHGQSVWIFLYDDSLYSMGIQSIGAGKFYETLKHKGIIFFLTATFLTTIFIFCLYLPHFSEAIFTMNISQYSHRYNEKLVIYFFSPHTQLVKCN